MAHAASEGNAAHIQIVSITYSGGTGMQDNVSIRVAVGGEKILCHTDDKTKGPIDAVVHGLMERGLIPKGTAFEKLEIVSEHGGSDARANAVVTLARGCERFRGEASHENTLQASIYACVAALNKVWAVVDVFMQRRDEIDEDPKLQRRVRVP